MKIIRPLKATPEMILSSSAVDTLDDYDGEEVYSRGARIIYTDRKRGPSVFQSAVDDNEGNQPDASPDEWVRVGPTGRWAPFDGAATTVSESEGGFELSFRVTETFNSIAFFEIYGAALTITARLDEGSEPYFTHTQELIDNSMVIDAYTYCFSPFDYIHDGIVSSIPPFRNAIVTIEIEGASRTGVGEIIVGDLIEIGQAEYGASHGIRDYSIIKEDDFGNREMEQGPWAKINNLQVHIEKNRHRYASRIFAELRATPAVFIGSENPQHEPLIVFGLLKEARGIIQYPSATLFNLEINGLI